MVKAAARSVTEQERLTTEPVIHVKVLAVARLVMERVVTENNRNL